MPPKELPGFWFDESRNRYFPNSTPGRAAASNAMQPPERCARSFSPPDVDDGWESSQASGAGGGGGGSQARKRKCYERTSTHGLLRKMKADRGLGSVSRRRRLVSEFSEIRRRAYVPFTECVATEDVIDGTYMDRYASMPTLTSLWLPSNNGEPVQDEAVLCGDSEGFVYRRMPDHGLDGWSTRSAGRWRKELSLGSTITSIDSRNGVYMATAFGPKARILVSSLSEENGPYTSSVFAGTGVHDLRSCRLSQDGRSGYVAGQRRLIHLTNLDDNSMRASQSIKMESDAMAIGIRKQETMIGTRDGRVFLWDSRVSSVSPYVLFKSQRNSPVLHVSVVREWEMLVSQLNGDLDLYDMRFLCRRYRTDGGDDPSGAKPGTSQATGTTTSSFQERTYDPIVRFHGHSNDHTFELGIAHDTHGSLLFAAGDDHLVRGWDMRTGQSLLPPPTPPPPMDDLLQQPLPPRTKMTNSLYRVGEKLLSTRFMEPVRSMVLVESPYNTGTEGVTLKMVNRQKVLSFGVGRSVDN